MQNATAKPSNSLDDLPAKVASLSAELDAVQRQNQAQTEQILKQDEQLAKRDQQIDQLLEYIELLRRKRFGSSSDQLSDKQLNLFDESELESLIDEHTQAQDEQTEKPSDSTDDTPQPPKQKPKRQKLPSHLTRVERIVDLSEAEKTALGKDWVLIGYDSAEQLAVIPRQFYVIEYKRAKYAPVNDQVPGAEAGVKIAPRPAQIIPKSTAHASLLAHVVTAKFVDALPLYRQEKGFERDGIDISRQTMASWMIQLLAPLTPVAEALKRHLKQGRVIHVDETTLQVLDEPGREATQKSYMWVYRGGPPDKPVVWFHYTDSRAGLVAREFLFPEEDDSVPGDPTTELTPFYLQSDGYTVYEALAKHPGVLGHAGCWAHVRRKFVDAANGRKNTAAAHQMVAYIGKLYAVERAIRGEDPQERQRVRQEQSAPILKTIKDWLDAKAKKTLPKGLLGKAIGYALGQWPILSTFLEDGLMEIDNNKAENAIRPFVIGRKNWLFSGSPRGAEASAMFYSLIETAKANGLEPWAYLNHLFEQLPIAKTPEAIEALLPHHLKMDDLKGSGQ